MVPHVITNSLVLLIRSCLLYTLPLTWHLLEDLASMHQNPTRILLGSLSSLTIALGTLMFLGLGNQAVAAEPLLEQMTSFGPIWTNGKLDGITGDAIIHFDVIPEIVSLRVGLDAQFGSVRNSSLGFGIGIQPDWPIYPGVGYRFAWNMGASMTSTLAPSSTPAFTMAPETFLGIRIPTNDDRNAMGLEYRFTSSALVFYFTNPL